MKMKIEQKNIYRKIQLIFEINLVYIDETILFASARVCMCVCFKCIHLVCFYSDLHLEVALNWLVDLAADWFAGRCYFSS